MSKNPLFQEFSSVSAKEWKQKIQFDLKGADYNETLVWESPEGIKVKPFYHADDAVSTPGNLTSGSGWNVGQSIYAGNAKAANKNAKEVLRKGAEAIYFIITSEDVKISELLDGVTLADTKVYLELQFLSSRYFKTVLDFAGDAQENLYLNIDPIGNLARTGNWFFNFEKDYKELDTILSLEYQNSLSVDISLYQNAGANRVQQLAYAIAHANEYLNHMSDKGLASTISFKISIDTNYFFEIAKLRAIRLLFITLAKEYGVSENCHIVAVPTRRNKTLYDYNTNMLRTTTECMSAVLGGANAVLNLPYDAIYHKDNDFGDRISLNQLLLLKNESYFDKVDNAADGSYYIESITNQLAEKALLLFKSIESGGGFLKQLKAHTIQRKIQESAEKEQARFDAGDEVLVGTNRYQNENDKMKDTIELYPFLKTNARKTLIQPILEKRLAEEVEQKRLNDE
ncbi:methylmalonyl-CoA mutase [Maribacter algarum]|uniref:Methylmalonyl-CoA mutase n=1 Tax=Maribacter algarum (ex Zhang et al. 2020) TaxID=2578118 RepID=A0A5S3PZ50_9FLAO|nr:methylmalonyl-CoA mutase subunit beta [Maribacter algarum]TMM58597.1 methylmalonyl-CoA mutase [Maribacter algarum]